MDNFRPCQTHFWPHSLKNHWSHLNFSWICIRKRTISLLYPFIVVIKPILAPRDQSVHIKFLLTNHKIFQSIFNFTNLYQYAKNQAYFINFFFRYNWPKNPAIWLAESINTNISETRFYLSMEFLQEYKK